MAPALSPAARAAWNLPTIAVTSAESREYGRLGTPAFSGVAAGAGSDSSGDRLAMARSAPRTDLDTKRVQDTWNHEVNR